VNGKIGTIYGDKGTKKLQYRFLLFFVGKEGGRNSTFGINRFLIIFNSHQIELTGVTSSATHGVINEIMGINFD